MKPLYSDIDFDKCRSSDKLPFSCYQCGNTFYTRKILIKRILSGRQNGSSQFCSRYCHNQFKTKNIEVQCKQCLCQFLKKEYFIKEGSNNFCSRSCSVTYNNLHKTHGTRRSKLEVWLEEQLNQLYPFKIHYNQKDAINSELDIYIPSLQLAFELNGIYHYEPIYGPEKLASVQNNDHRKFQACLEQNIEFCIIDTSMFKHFKEDKARKFLIIIQSIIDQRLDTKTLQI